MTVHTHTAEFVSPRHPDKLCDLIADLILDAYLEQDPDARCAIEVMGGHGVISISGEVTSGASVDIESIVERVAGEGYKVNVYLEKQSAEIARGVDTGGAGDQGIMIGYALSETENLLPLEYELARKLCADIYEIYPYDGKTQVTLAGGEVKSVVASFQNSKTSELEELVRSLIDVQEYIINPAGEWNIGGFDADSGLSGRKIVVDSYGPRIPVGGGSFSGKDATKVDRSGAYMARKIAVDYVKNREAHEVLVKLAYAIGKTEPVMANAIVNMGGITVTQSIEDYDLRPAAIIEQLGLKRPMNQLTCQWGHFGNGFPWDE